ncbi:MAG TPA: class I SAM-dependent methyltransferase [Pyrinomonadaceae bacterium]|jgi:ubiquinone/menaquinone biosynthesis C-methylase UbiE|nr:class I SAM-dependent methyltransferase [Pyrinomonadaceae bacterium]
MSEKSAREAAFLRDLYIDNDWTARFTSLLDKNLILPKEGSLLYVEPGSGNHLISLPERIKDKSDDKVELFSVHSDIELLRIAQAKAKAMMYEIEFLRSAENRFSFPDEKFTTIIADATFIPPQDLPAFLAELSRAVKKGGHVAFFLPTAGSFGEFFSILWEALFNTGMEGLSPQIEEIIGDIPQITQVEAIAEIAGLKSLKSVTKTEFFDYENGTVFINSFLMTEFFLPRWLKFLTRKEKEKIVPEIIRTIDGDRTDMTFRFSIKATVVSGKKP